MILKKRDFIFGVTLFLGIASLYLLMLRRVTPLLFHPDEAYVTSTVGVRLDGSLGETYLNCLHI